MGTHLRQVALEAAGIGFSFADDSDGGKKAFGTTYSAPETAAES